MGEFAHIGRTHQYKCLVWALQASCTDTISTLYWQYKVSCTDTTSILYSHCKRCCVDTLTAKWALQTTLLKPISFNYIICFTCFMAYQTTAMVGYKPRSLELEVDKGLYGAAFYLYNDINNDN